MTQSNSSANPLKSAAGRPGRPAKSLAARLAFLVGTAMIVQLSLSVVLWNLRDTADACARGLGLAREASGAVRTITARALSAIAWMDIAESRGFATFQVNVDDLHSMRDSIAWINEHSADTKMASPARSLVDLVKEMLSTGERTCIEVQRRQLERRRNVEPLTPVTPPERVKETVSRYEEKIFEHLELLQKEQKLFAQSETAKFDPQPLVVSFATVTGGIVLNALVLTVFGFIFSTSIGARLASVQETVFRIQRRARLLPALDGSDEIAQLDESFHEMASLLEQAQAREKMIFEYASTILCAISVDAPRRFLQVNTEGSRILGYKPETMIGKSLDAFVPADEREACMNFLKSVAAGKPQPPLAVTMIKGDGSVLETLWTPTLTEAADKIFCLMHDISARKAAQRLRREMVQMVTNELRSPLATIGAIYASVRNSSGCQLNEKGERLLGSAETNVNRMLRLINDLLDIEKLEEGQLELNKIKTDLTALLNQSIDSVSFLASEKKITVTNLSAGETAIADVDPLRIVQVLVNLLANAIKFSPPESQIALALRQSKKFVEIAVADQGRGIPEHLLADVFKRFQQVQRGDATEKGGSGLGLAISRSLIELHGGSISVESKVAEGTTFTIKLPL